jgi:murein DD-endopeptidase MepM/ murein hydrolase activator NlpD
MEVQNRKSGSKPITTVKLHGVPAALRTPNEPLVTVKLHGALRLNREQTQTQTSSPAPAQKLPQTPIAPIPPEPVAPKQAAIIPIDVLRPETPQAASAESLASLPPLTLPPPTRTPPQPPASTAPALDKMRWPVSGKVSSGFGRRKRRLHAGIDIPMPQGTPIVAAQDGVVLKVIAAKSKGYRGYGNAVLIDHGSGIVTMYAHCQSVSVKAGQRVKQGEVVGLVGNTGRTTTHHIHFEVRKDGKAVDPIPYLAAR